jgi:hypothetical protein
MDTMRGGRLGGGATVLSDLDDDAMVLRGCRKASFQSGLARLTPMGSMPDAFIKVSASLEAVEEGRAGAPGG